jgi:hypothetical protein
MYAYLKKKKISPKKHFMPKNKPDQNKISQDLRQRIKKSTIANATLFYNLFNGTFFLELQFAKEQKKANLFAFIQ